MTLRQTIAELQSRLYRNESTKSPNWYNHSNDLIVLRRYAMRLRRLYEHSCNGCTREKYPHETWEAYDLEREKQMTRNDRLIERTETRIKNMCEYLGVKYYIQGDPRGAALYLGTESDERYSTEGVAIY